MPLLEDRANVDHAVDACPRRGEATHRRIGRVRQEYGELAKELAACIREGIEAPRAVGTGGMAELHRLGVGQAHDGCGMKTHADREARVEVLVVLGVVGAQQFRPGAARENRGQFSPEVDGVLHRHVHALAGLGAVGVAGIACDEDARQA